MITLNVVHMGTNNYKTHWQMIFLILIITLLLLVMN